MFVEKLTRDDVLDFLGKTMFNPKSDLKVRDEDIYHNNNRFSISVGTNSRSEGYAKVFWGSRYFEFYDFDSFGTGGYGQNYEHKEYEAKINEAWRDFLGKKFGDDYVECFQKEEQKRKDFLKENQGGREL